MHHRLYLLVHIAPWRSPSVGRSVVDGSKLRLRSKSSTLEVKQYQGSAGIHTCPLHSWGAIGLGKMSAWRVRYVGKVRFVVAVVIIGEPTLLSQSTSASMLGGVPAGRCPSNICYCSWRSDSLVRSHPAPITRPGRRWHGMKSELCFVKVVRDATSAKAALT